VIDLVHQRRPDRAWLDPVSVESVVSPSARGPDLMNHIDLASLSGEPIQ
jgi:hypothetical protein